MPYADTDKQKEFMKNWVETNRNKHNSIVLKYKHNNKDKVKQYNFKRRLFLKEFRRLSHILLP